MKRKKASAMASTLRHADPDKLLNGYPHLQEFLTAAVYEGEDTRREAPTVTVWCSGGFWKASVKDRSEGLVMWLQGSTVLELLSQLELFVMEEEGPWRHDESTHPRNGKRQQKST